MTSSRPPRSARSLALALLPFALLVSCNDDDSDPASTTVDRGAKTPTSLTRHDTAPGIVFTITGVAGASGSDGSFQVGDRVAVTFTIKKKDGSWWRIDDFSTGRAMVSGPTVNYQRVLPQQSDVVTAAVSNPDGSYTYTFPDPLPAAYAAPLNDSPSFTGIDGEMTGQPLLAGTYTVGMYVYWDYTVDGVSYRDPATAIFDFRLGGATDLAPREVVKNDNCNQCHQTVRAHGGGRQDVRLCILCHTSGSEDRNTPTVAGGTPGVSIDFRVMIHKIHNAAHLPSVSGVGTKADGSRDYTLPKKPYEILGFNDSLIDMSHVRFPVWPDGLIATPRDLGYTALSATNKAIEDTIRTGVTGCATCHGDPDGSGPLTAPAQGRLAYAQPSRNACGSCHDDIDWTRPYIANGSTMPAQANDAACLLCHDTGNSLDTEKAHLHPLRDPDFDRGTKFTIASLAEAGASNNNGAIDPGEKIRLTVTATDDLGNPLVASDIASITVVVAGPTSNSNVLLNASIPPAALTGSQPFALNVPMPVLLEYAGTSTAAPAEVFQTGYAPHWTPLAPTTVYVATPASGGASTLSTAAPAVQNWIDVGDATGFARNDYVVIDSGVAGKTEYLQVQWVDGNRLWFGSSASTSYAPGLRHAHGAGASVGEVTLTTKTAGTQYSLDAQTGRVTELVEFGVGIQVVVSYTTDFVLPATYPLALNDTPTIDESGGKWAGKPLVDGTYGVVVYAVRNLTLNRFGESNSYRSVSIASRKDFLVGAAKTLEPYALIDGDAGCNSCHQDLSFHGGGRRGLESCLACHGTAGSEDRPRYVAPGAPATPGTTIGFRAMLHKIHAGAGLTQGGQYEVVGFGSGAYPNNYSVATYDEVVFPQMPGGVLNCTKCHGASNTAWQEPKPRNHPDGQQKPTKSWTVACGACHDSDAAQAHIGAQTSPAGGESCATCHADDRDWPVQLMHKVR